MYLTARITIDLANSTVELRPPSNFFGGVANVLTRGHWSTREEIETYKLLAFAQSTYRALREMGVSDVLRVTIGKEVVYEDREERTNDFELAMEELERRLRRGLEPDPTGKLDLVLRHQDKVLTYVVELAFRREHKPGAYPVSIKITAVPVALRQLPAESDAEYEQRVKGELESQQQLDDATEHWRAQLDKFTNSIEGHFRSTLGVDGVKKDVFTAIPAARDQTSLAHALGYGFPFYGFIMADLLYFSFWDSIWQRDIRVHDSYYGDPWEDGYYIGDDGWDYDYATTTGFQQIEPAAALSTSDSSDSGGWFSGIGDFLGDISSSIGDIGGSDGGSGDSGSGDSGGIDSGGSSCGSCGGGGCGGGGGGD